MKHFHTMVKSKNLRSNHHKLGTMYSINYSWIYYSHSDDITLGIHFLNPPPRTLVGPQSFFSSLSSCLKQLPNFSKGEGLMTSSFKGIGYIIGTIHKINEASLASNWRQMVRNL